MKTSPPTHENHLKCLNTWRLLRPRRFRSFLFTNKHFLSASGLSFSILLGFLMMIIAGPASAQSTCQNAHILPGTDTCLVLSSKSVYWIKFQATYPKAKLKVFSASNSITGLTFFEGQNCNVLTRKDSLIPANPTDTALLNVDSLVKGQTYYLKMTFAQSGSYTFCLDNGPKLPVPCVDFWSIHGTDYCCPISVPCTLNLACPGEQVCLNANSVFWLALEDSLTGYSYCIQFDFGGAIPNPPCNSNNDPQCVVFPAGGLYPVVMSSFINGVEYYETPVFYINILDAADASFTVTPAGPICPGDCIDVTINNLDYSGQYFVDWGDGSSGVPVNYPYHHCYDFDGTYNITVYAQNACGLDSSTQQLQVRLLAQIQGPDTICIGSSATFQGSCPCPNSII